MIIDCFLFNDELDLLEIRLNELCDIVDVFVLTESEYTFTGVEKPLHFSENEYRYTDFNIVHTIYKPAEKYSPQVFEKRQKQFNLDCAYFNFFNHGDIVIQGDCDEIPKSNVLRKAVDYNWSSALLVMDLFYYWLNCKYVGKKRLFKNSRLLRPKDRIRYNAKQNDPVDEVYTNAGWHFSYLGDIKSKLASWGHADEYNKPPFNTTEHIDRCRNDGIDLFGRKNMKFEFIDDFSYLPKYVTDNMDRFKDWIRQ